jgi:hypothetical protein
MVLLQNSSSGAPLTKHFRDKKVGNFVWTYLDVRSESGGPWKAESFPVSFVSILLNVCAWGEWGGQLGRGGGGSRRGQRKEGLTWLPNIHILPLSTSEATYVQTASKQQWRHSQVQYKLNSAAARRLQYSINYVELGHFNTLETNEKHI